MSLYGPRDGSAMSQGSDCIEGERHSACQAKSRQALSYPTSPPLIYPDFCVPELSEDSGDSTDLLFDLLATESEVGLMAPDSSALASLADLMPLPPKYSAPAT